jgi:2-polyprenyl-3-methyl-5-hydroxy-6-metoxy-1,4-benzoquinol methylase
MQNESFFNFASTFYDNMISFEKSILNRMNFYNSFLDKSKTDIVDLGCGTGIDSICLAKLGYNVTAFDISKEMLNKAIENANNHNVKIKFRNVDLTGEINFSEKYDYVISMGNTLANIPFEKIKSLFINIKKILKPNGKFIFQIVNYNKILNEKKRILGVTEDATKIYIRFYDFLNSHINFNILTITKNNLKQNDLITTNLYPYTHEKINNLLLECGFNDIEYFSGFNKNKTDFKYSDDIIYKVE